MVPSQKPIALGKERKSKHPAPLCTVPCSVLELQGRSFSFQTPPPRQFFVCSAVNNWVCSWHLFWCSLGISFPLYCVPSCFPVESYFRHPPCTKFPTKGISCTGTGGIVWACSVHVGISHPTIVCSEFDAVFPGKEVCLPPLVSYPCTNNASHCSKNCGFLSAKLAWWNRGLSSCSFLLRKCCFDSLQFNKLYIKNQIWLRLFAFRNSVLSVVLRRLLVARSVRHTGKRTCLLLSHFFVAREVLVGLSFCQNSSKCSRSMKRLITESWKLIRSSVDYRTQGMKHLWMGARILTLWFLNLCMASQEWSLRFLASIPWHSSPKWAKRALLYTIWMIKPTYLVFYLCGDLIDLRNWNWNYTAFLCRQRVSTESWRFVSFFTRLVTVTWFVFVNAVYREKCSLQREGSLCLASFARCTGSCNVRSFPFIQWHTSARSFFSLWFHGGTYWLLFPKKRTSNRCPTRAIFCYSCLCF